METTTKERPILFNGEMVRAILEGRKTQTRRVIKHTPRAVNTCGIYHRPDGLFTWTHLPGHAGVAIGLPFACPYGVLGDNLWVREPIQKSDSIGKYGPMIEYVADGQLLPMSNWCWKPRKLAGMYMPKGASRITLEIVSVKVERVKDISEDDAEAEGAQHNYNNHRSIAHDEPWRLYRAAFQDLWDSINAKRGFGWEINPWVWVVEFKRINVR